MALDPAERRLCGRLRPQGGALLDELRECVAIPTGLGHEPGLARLRARMAERLAELGALIEEVPGEPAPAWLRAAAPGGDGAGPPPVVVAARRSGRAPRVLLAGHLDTVHDPHGRFRALSVSADGRTATGPGAVDMKGGLVVALAALEALRAEEIDLDWTFLLNSDEESGSFTSETALRRAARDHDAGIVLEPALPGGALALERMGSGQFQVEVFGRAAHVGRAFKEGCSAVVGLARVILKLAELSRPDEGLIVNPGPLAGPAVTNIVPDYAACWCNARFADAEKARVLAAALDGLATSADAMPRVAVHRRWNRPVKPATERVRALAEAARRVAEDLGGTLPFERTGGVCDGNILQDEGLPTIDTLGVRGGNLHRDDEFVEVASLVERAQLLAVLLSRLARGRVALGG